MSLLTFPQDPLPIRGEMLIAGTWTDITSRIRLASEIVIANRGRGDNQGRPGVCTCSFTLNNRDGYFSSRALLSANYGKLGKNIPVRFSVTEERSFAVIDPSSETARVRTADKASLDIVGDLDVRIEYEADQFTNGQGTVALPQTGYFLAGKYRRTASNNRSWFLAVNAFGYPVLEWSTDGTFANVFGATATAPLPQQYGSIALRATIDVDNGAAGRTITFYTSDTIGGTWTALGAPVVQATVTSIFSSTADLEVGRLDDGHRDVFTGFYGFGGRIYAFELRSGIGGTLVANAAITAQARGTTSWSDGLAAPNTWLVDTPAEVTPDDRRFYGELSSLPQQWDISGRDVFVPSTASDVTRRLQRGGDTIASAWSQYWQAVVATGLNSTTAVSGYWAFEDGDTATSAANGVPRGAAATISNCTFGSASDLPASDGVITLTAIGSRIYGRCRRAPASLGGFSFANFAFKMPSVPAASVTLLDFTGLGGIGRINISVTATNYNTACYDNDGALIASSGTLFGPPVPNAWVVMRLQISQVGGTANVDLGWYHPGDEILYGAVTLAMPGVSGGMISGFTTIGQTNNVGTQFAQLAIGNYFLDNTLSSYVKVADAFARETTTDRWTRVCSQNGITGSVVGPASAERMGAQPKATVMEVLYECVDTEQGLMYPSRSSAALIMRSRGSLYNQYGPSIGYNTFELGNKVPLPTDDDQLLRNTVTASRAGGSSVTATVDTGPNSTASATATPPGVGIVPTAINRNTFTDDRLADMASWDALLGTWDELRWPQVRVDFERSPYTNTAAKLRKLKTLTHLDVGDIFTLTGLVQAGIPPDDAAVIIQGLTETLGNRKWWIEWNTTPAGPYLVNNLTSLPGNSRYRAAATASTVSAFTSTATGAAAFTITTPAGSALWGTTASKPGNFPLNVVIAGEVITLSAITGTTSPQSATVSARGVNNGGVGKAHLIGESIQVQYPFSVGL